MHHFLVTSLLPWPLASAPGAQSCFSPITGSMVGKFYDASRTSMVVTSSSMVLLSSNIIKQTIEMELA